MSRTSDIRGHSAENMAIVTDRLAKACQSEASMIVLAFSAIMLNSENSDSLISKKKVKDVDYSGGERSYGRPDTISDSIALFQLHWNGANMIKQIIIKLQHYVIL